MFIMNIRLIFRCPRNFDHGNQSESCFNCSQKDIYHINLVERKKTDLIVPSALSSINDLFIVQYCLRINAIEKTQGIM